MPLCRLGDRLFRHGEASLQVIERVVSDWLRIPARRSVRREFESAEGLEEGDDVEMAFADDDVLRFLADLGLVLQMDAVDAVAKRQDAFDRVFAARKKVAAIDAGADPPVVVLDRFHHAVQLVVQRAGAMVVNRDADVVFGDELVEAGERLGVGLRIGGDRANAELLGEFENPPVGGMILARSD